MSSHAKLNACSCSIAPLGTDLILATGRVVASLLLAYGLTFNAAIFETTRLREYACLLPLPRQSSIAQWNIMCSIFGLQGGGLYITGTATLTNTIVNSNTASDVCSPVRPCLNTYHHTELTLELTVCCARAHDFGATAKYCCLLYTSPSPRDS